MVKPTVQCLRCQCWRNQPLSGYQPDLGIPLRHVHLQPRSPAHSGYSKTQGGTYSLTVGMVASLLPLTGLTMDHDLII
jgi:hypothetical protein